MSVGHALLAIAAAKPHGQVSGTSSCTISRDGVVQGLCTAGKSIHIPVEYRTILPVLILIIGAAAILVISSVIPKRSRPGLWPTLSTLIGGAALISCAFLWTDIDHHGARLAIGGQVAFDHFAVFFMIIIATTVVLGSLVADGYLQREGLDGPEPYVLLLLCASGGMIMAESAGLIMLFLGLEVLSISLYVLAAYHRRRTESGEAGMKYFILGSLASAIFLYGAALVYGATGSTQFSDIATFLARNHIASNGVLLAGMGMLIVGLGFKVTAVPFHAWSPDVYQGSPAGFTGFMTAVAKAAGFAGLLRILVSALSSQRVDWRPAIWLIAVLSLVVGGVMAIVQRDMKRMLAYSSINHAGYILIGLQAATAQGTSGALYYLLVYSFLIIGSFAIVSVVQGQGEADNDISAFRGLASRSPWLAGAMTIFLLAQAGVPLTTGFLAKFYVISASVQQGQYALGIIGMVVAALTAFFYLRIAIYMFTPLTGAAGETAGTGPAGSTLDTGPAPAMVDIIGAPAGASVGVGGTGGGGGPAAGAVAGGPAAGSLAGGPAPSTVDIIGGPADAVAAGTRPAVRLVVPVATAAAIGVCVAYTVVFGVFPAPVIDFAKRATLMF